MLVWLYRGRVQRNGRGSGLLGRPESHRDRPTMLHVERPRLLCQGLSLEVSWPHRRWSLCPLMTEDLERGRVCRVGGSLMTRRWWRQRCRRWKTTAVTRTTTVAVRGASLTTSLTRWNTATFLAVVPRSHTHQSFQFSRNVSCHSFTFTRY